ncbi:hypothetical protein JXA84_07835 [candidate division WOR-3 bacterium]|nr:hypothetical protein [candidate division WOR-3 bacterium]
MLDKDFIPVAAYIIGATFQCFGLLRKKPPKWSFFVFALMFVYIVFMMLYSTASVSGQVTTNESFKSIVINQGMTLGLAISFLFVSVFLKEIIRVINESVIISVTVSYMLLVFESRDLWSTAGICIAAVLGTFFSAFSVWLLLTKKKIAKPYKLILWGWFFFVNGFFAFSYYSRLGLDFSGIPTAVGKGEIGPLKMAVLGMISVQILVNFGILYYSFIYSLFSKQTRTAIISYTEKAFDDEQFNLKNIGITAIIQLSSYALITYFLSQIALEFIAFWVLLSPLITRGFGFFASKVSTR